MDKNKYELLDNNMKIALIGGSGVIGSEFIKQYESTLDLIDISRKSGNIMNYIEEEITKAAAGCNAMVILAGKKVNSKETQTYSIYEDNVRIAEEAMKSAIRLGIRNVVLTSTRCVYDDTSSQPVSENAPIRPINYYGISKYTSELVCDRYARLNGINLKILRVSQVLAAGGKNMIGIFIDNARNHKPLNVTANVSRDYIDIRDVCRGIKAALIDGAEMNGCYNLASGKATSVSDIALTIRDSFDHDVEVNLDIPENGQKFYLDVSKIEKELHFQCKYSLYDSICYLKS